MTKRKRRKKNGEEAPLKEEAPITNEPWIKQRTGLGIIGVMSLAFAIFIIWQLYPTEGAGSILWGLGIGASLWAVFGLSLAFNSFVRRKSK